MKESSVTVLIVDDEANMRKLLNPYLKNQGWLVIEADSGKMALEPLSYFLHTYLLCCYQKTKG